MADVPMKVEINCTTGVVSEVPLTDDEIAAQTQAATAYAAQQAQEQAAATAKATALASAETKLTALGLTSDEINAILGA
jgi:flagellar basal body P-ring protein FlgI